MPRRARYTAALLFAALFAALDVGLVRRDNTPSLLDGAYPVPRTPVFWPFVQWTPTGLLVLDKHVRSGQDEYDYDPVTRNTSVAAPVRPAGRAVRAGMTIVDYDSADPVIEVGAVEDQWLEWWNHRRFGHPPRKLRSVPPSYGSLKWVADAGRCDRMVWDLEFEHRSPLVRLLDWIRRRPAAAPPTQELRVSRKDGTAMRSLGSVETRPSALGIGDGRLAPSLSPDGRFVAFQYDDHVWIKRLEP